MAGSTPWGQLDPDVVIPWVEQQTERTLSPSQREAVAKVLASKVTVITGGPGVGKTTIVTSILKALQARRMRVVLCAPTGRAAKRLSEATGMEAKTIHRVLAFDPKAYGFTHDQATPLAADLVVIDETSMVDIVLMHQLLRAIPDQAAVLMVGDVDQLPSVGPGYGAFGYHRLGPRAHGAPDRHFPPGGHLANHCQCPPHQPGPHARDA